MRFVMAASACFWVSIRLLYVLFMVFLSVLSHSFVLCVSPNRS